MSWDPGWVIFFSCFFDQVFPLHYLSISYPSTFLSLYLASPGFMPVLCLGWYSLLKYICLCPTTCCAVVRRNRRINVEEMWRRGKSENRCTLNETEVEGEWTCKQSNLHRMKIQINTCKSLTVSKCARFGSFCDLLPASLLTRLSCSSSPGPEGEKAHSLSYGPSVFWGAYQEV